MKIVDNKEVKNFNEGMSAEKTKAVFLDRDGVINEEADHLSKVADLRFLPGAAHAIKSLNDHGYKVVVVTNQAAVAKGLAPLKAVHEIHGEMATRLAEEGALIDRFYYCPHHPEGTVAEYVMKCECRKPGTGMIEEAVAEFDINLAKSYLVGDKTGDILAGKRMGLKTILVKTGYGGSDGCYEVTPDFIANDLHGAADIILFSS